jgi:hypothetical protein
MTRTRHVDDPVERLPQGGAERPQSLPVPDPEDGAQDHREGELLRAGEDGRRFAERPARDLLRGHRPHRLLVVANPLAVKWRQHQLAAAQVLGPVGEEDAAGADQRPQDQVRDARVELVGPVGEDFADRVGVADDGPRLVEDPHGENVPVPSPAAEEEAFRVEAEEQFLGQGRHSKFFVHRNHLRALAARSQAREG